MAKLLRNLAVLAAPVLASQQVLGPSSSSRNIVMDDSFFYGQSEPVYPTPNGSGIGGWEAAYGNASALVSQMTLDEKVGLTSGVQTDDNACGGFVAPVPRLGFPGMCLHDAGNGVRATDFVNAYPSGIHAGASWNKALTYARAYHIGGEFYRKGVNIAMGPVVGPLGRIAQGGRNWEGFGNDPYHSGILAGLSVEGIQAQGAMACIKHFVGNEQELHRNIELDDDRNAILSVSSNMDDAALHELYVWPFADAVHSGSASLMCSYNRVNNSYACQNSKILNGVLKSELGFQGFVVTDWGAQHAGAASALAGLDMAMPTGVTRWGKFWGPKLKEAVQNGSVPESRLDDMATRILTAWYQTRQDSGFPEPGIGIPKDLLKPHPLIDARVPEARPVIFQAAVEGHVLVKNARKALPLKQPRVLSLFGYDAVVPKNNAPNNTLWNDWILGAQSSSIWPYACGMGSAFITDCPPLEPIAKNGTLITGEGSGATASGYISSPFDAIQQQAIKDGTQLYWDFINDDSTGIVHPYTDAALVFINAAAGEGRDRPALRDDFSDALVRNIAAQSANTIVVIHNAGIRLVDQWIEHPNVTAVIFAHLPGQDAGRALVEILYGRVSPSGKLPYTVARNESDYGGLLAPVADYGEGGYFSRFPQDNYTEGLFIDYRAFDNAGIESRFEFGFGLSYAEFAFANLSIRPLTNASDLSAYPRGQILPGGAADLWDVVVEVTADVTNVGDVIAHEVAQLYLTIPAPGRPVRQLRGFEKVLILPGVTTTVTFKLRRRDLSFWDVTAQAWKLVLDQEYTVYVGNSSRTLPLVGKLSLA